MQFGIRLEMEWIPRSENEVEDYISRIVDLDDWQINPNIFPMIDSLWGPHTVDRFASVANTQLPRYNSKFWRIGLEAVDTFTVNWAIEVNWWVPPLHLIVGTINMLSPVLQRVLQLCQSGNLPTSGLLSAPMVTI